MDEVERLLRCVQKALWGSAGDVIGAALEGLPAHQRAELNDALREEFPECDHDYDDDE